MSPPISMSHQPIYYKKIGRFPPISESVVIVGNQWGKSFGVIRLYIIICLMRQSSIIIYNVVHQLNVFKTEKNRLLYSLIVGLCDTQIGEFPLIFTDKTHRQIKKETVIKSADCFLSVAIGRSFLVSDKSFGVTYA